MTTTADETTTAATHVRSPLTVRPRSRVQALLRVLGPAWIVMLADVDAPSVLTAAKPGTDFGYAIPPAGHRPDPGALLAPPGTRLLRPRLSSDRSVLGPLANSRRQAAVLWVLTAGLLGLGLLGAGA